MGKSCGDGRAPSSDVKTGTTTTTTTTTTGGATTAFPSPAGVGETRNTATPTTTTTTTTTTPPRGTCTPSPLVFWVFAGLGWLDFLVVAILVTPGNDWLRQDGGSKVGWFGVGGDGHAASASCDAGVLSDDWCNKFEAFRIVQVVATASISAAALVLLAAVCRPRPRRWGIASSIFFFLYAIMQAVAVWMVVGLWRDVEDAPEEIVTETGLFTSFPIDLDYGATFAIAFYAGVAGFNEGLLLLAFAKHSGKGRSLKDTIHHTLPVPSRDLAAAPTHPRASADV